MKFFSVVLAFFLLVFSVGAFPLNFSTPVNGSSQSQNSSVWFNATLNLTGGLTNLTWNWDGANFTIYNASLILSYDFDNVAALGENATKCVDTSLASNNGTFLPVGAYPVWNTSGKYGGSLTFNTTGYVLSPLDSSALNGTYGFTVATWYIVPVNYHNQHVALCSYNQNPEMLSSSTGALRIVMTNIDCVSNTSFSAGLWHHALYTWNRTTLTGWVDGLQVCQVAVSDVTSYSCGSTGTLMPIGAQGGINVGFNGTLDEFQIWNRSLTNAEIQQTYRTNLAKYSPSNWTFTALENLTQANHNYQYQLWAFSPTDLNTTQYQFVSTSSGAAAPVTTCNASGAWSNQNQLVALNGTSAAGVAYTQHWLNGVGASNATVFTVSTEANNSVSFYSQGVDGLLESNKTCFVPVDKTAPVTTDNAPSTVQSSQITVTLSPTDSLSGVAFTSYRIDGEAWANGTSFVLPRGNHTFDYFSQDNAGNIEATHNRFAEWGGYPYSFNGENYACFISLYGSNADASHTNELIIANITSYFDSCGINANGTNVRVAVWDGSNYVFGSESYVSGNYKNASFKSLSNSSAYVFFTKNMTVAANQSIARLYLGSTNGSLPSTTRVAWDNFADNSTGWYQTATSRVITASKVLFLRGDSSPLWLNVSRSSGSVTLILAAQNVPGNGRYGIYARSNITSSTQCAIPGYNLIPYRPGVSVNSFVYQVTSTSCAGTAINNTGTQVANIVGDGRYNLFSWFGNTKYVAVTDASGNLQTMGALASDSNIVDSPAIPSQWFFGVGTVDADSSYNFNFTNFCFYYSSNSNGSYCVVYSNPSNLTYDSVSAGFSNPTPLNGSYLLVNQSIQISASLSGFTSAYFYWQGINTSISSNNFSTTISLGGLGVYPFNITACSAFSCVSENRVLYYGGYLNVSVFDEQTMLPVYANISVSNGSSSVAGYGHIVTFFYADTPQGTNTVTVQNSSYFQRVYFVTSNSTTGTNLSAYLVEQNSYALLTRFHVQNTLQGGIVGALVSIKLSPNCAIAANTTVGQGYTDSSGTAAFYMNINTQYQIVVSASGYAVSTTCLTPVSQDYYLTLSTGGAATVPLLFQNLSVVLVPVYFNSTPQVQTVVLTVTDSNLNLTNASLSLFNANGSLFYSSSLSNSSGGQLSVNVNASLHQPYFVAGVSIFRQGFAEFSFNRTIMTNQSMGQGNYSYGKWVNALNASDASPFTKGFLAILFSIICTGWVGMYLGYGYAGLAAVLFLTFFSAMFGGLQVALIIGLLIAGIWLVVTKVLRGQ